MTKVVCLCVSLLPDSKKSKFDSGAVNTCVKEI